jgi:hypothetical protein
MARLEWMRLRLGLTEDDRIFQLALAKTQEWISASRQGYFDDDHEGRGRYDVYTFHAPLNTEPLWDLLPKDSLQRVFDAHERLLTATSRPDGWTVCWGRSAEHSALSAIELAAVLLARGKCQDDPALLLGLAARAAHRYMRDWWKDDAVFAHRRGMTHWYRGPSRLMEFSCCTLASLATAAQQFRQADPSLVAEVAPGALYPEQDEWISFDDRGLGVWCYRKGELDFQLALVDGYTSDYCAAPVSPGLFEQIVDNGMACGVPNVFYGETRYLPLRRPDNIRWKPGSFSWVTPVFTHYTDFDWWKPSQDVTGTRSVTIKVNGAVIEGDEHWRFDRKPDAVAMQFAESQTPLRVEWTCDQPHQAFTVAVEGMRDWRSYWNAIRNVHQIDIDPAREIRLRWRIQRR